MEVLQNEILSFDDICLLYPDQWVLIGSPELDDPNTLGSIVSKLVSGVVLLASKDKREIGYKAKYVRQAHKSVTCVYTGKIPQNRKWLL